MLGKCTKFGIPFNFLLNGKYYQLPVKNNCSAQTQVDFSVEGLGIQRQHVKSSPQQGAFGKDAQELGQARRRMNQEPPAHQFGQSHPDDVSA